MTARRTVLLATLMLAGAGTASAAETPSAVSPLLILPFLLLLVSIAIAPFISKRWWERSYPAVSLLLGASTLVYYIVALGDRERMLRTASEYASFIVLIGSLFVVSGGIHLRIRGKATPIANVVLLAIGALASNLVGTTGASMILIRPYLRANKDRLRGFHIVFFIFIVSNIGGALTPIGDPPLFLGYLRGVPFFWVAEHCWPMWALAVGLVLAIFAGIDTFSFRRYSSLHGPDGELHEQAEVQGLANIVFLAMILVGSFIEHPPLLREAIMLLAAAGSYWTTRGEIRKRNEFSFQPIKEVAILFAGIFLTMVPALDWLELHASTIGIKSPGQFYWGTGMLSSVLDNAPTYLNFLSASIGLFVNQEIVLQVRHLVANHGADIALIGGSHAEEVRATFATLMKYHADLVANGDVPIDEIKIAYLIGNHNLYLLAISLGAVFFGAFTYIGNGPNFMVKSIAEHSGAPTPSFIGYILRYSLPVLLPVFAIVWWLYFRT